MDQRIEVGEGSSYSRSQELITGYPSREDGCHLAAVPYRALASRCTLRGCAASNRRDTLSRYARDRRRAHRVSVVRRPHRRAEQRLLQLANTANRDRPALRGIAIAQHAFRVLIEYDHRCAVGSARCARPIHAIALEVDVLARRRA
jgi:hypothetical protein